jgi:hypothetical protein
VHNQANHHLPFFKRPSWLDIDLLKKTGKLMRQLMSLHVSYMVEPEVAIETLSACVRFHNIQDLVCTIWAILAFSTPPFRCVEGFSRCGAAE